ncbi:MAG: hypothetical protein JXB36_02950 [Gammaproteobacteria bacterium]|nr:hypothetical protein [Gammaproteobacteria bacterium]
MATGISHSRRTAMMTWWTGTAQTQPGNQQVALSTADPGDAAASLAEVSTSGTGYSRQSITAGSGWSVTGTAGNPVQAANAALITMGTVTGGGWGALTHVATFTGTAQTSAAEFHGRYAIAGGPITPNVGATVTIAIGALTMTFSFT